MGPFPIAVRQLKFLIVGIDYFTKWVEAETLVTIIEKNVRSFIWRHIICRYGIPRVLVSDNRKQFDNDSFQDFCSQLGIKNHYSSHTHPKLTDKLRSQTDYYLKLSRLGSRVQRVYGLKSCQAYYRTTARTPIGETPFRLTYRSEAIIPAEVRLTSYRVDNHDESKNDEAMRLQLDLLDEVRATVEQRLARY